MTAATQVTVIGRLVTDVTARVTPGGDKVANFRIACQERQYDKANDIWADGDRMYVSISCWRHVADHAEASLKQGDQVIARGRLKLRKYEAADGEHRTALEVDATSIGPDLALHTVAVTRPNWPISPNQQSLLTVKPPPPTPDPKDADSQKPETQQPQSAEAAPPTETPETESPQAAPAQAA
jgi:single-strand DNA-binding protein